MADTEGSTGERLKAARKAAGLSLAKAAAASGLHKVSIARWEGGRGIQADNLATLARIYGTTVGALAGEGDSRTATGQPYGNKTAPSLVEGAETASQLVSEAERSVAYWIGKQQGLLQVLEYVQALQRNASDMQGKAIEAQREIIGRTIPMPAEDAADRERRIRDALDAEAERQARERNQRHGQRRASGGAPPPPPRGGGARRRKPPPDSSA